MLFVFGNTIIQFIKMEEKNMKKINALSFTLEEFKTICDRVLNNRAWIENDHKGWFWAYEEGIDDEEINRLLELEFSKEVSGFRIDKIYVDLSGDMVIVSYK